MMTMIIVFPFYLVQLVFFSSLRVIKYFFSTHWVFFSCSLQIVGNLGLEEAHTERDTSNDSSSSSLNTSLFIVFPSILSLLAVTGVIAFLCLVRRKSKLSKRKKTQSFYSSVIKLALFSQLSVVQSPVYHKSYVCISIAQFYLIAKSYNSYFILKSCCSENVGQLEKKQEKSKLGESYFTPRKLLRFSLFVLYQLCFFPVASIRCIIYLHDCLPSLMYCW